MSIACEADALHGAQTAGGHWIEVCTPSGIGRSRRPANKHVAPIDSAPTARKPAPLPACRLRSVPPKVASRATPEFQPSRYEPQSASQPRHATHQHTTHAPTRPRCQHPSCESIRLEPDPARTTHLVPPAALQRRSTNTSPSAHPPAAIRLAEAAIPSIGHVAGTVPRHALLEPALPDPNWWAHPEGEACWCVRCVLVSCVPWL
jgi:hypothetical protein